MSTEESLPQAYRDGFCDFYGRKYKVSPDVLIPRPETEQMVDAFLTLIGKPFLPGVKPEKAVLSKKCKVLDVGTGSGCIAISLKLEDEEAKILATDISDKALKVAKQNAKELGAGVEFIKSDLLEDVSESADIVVANLPYVDKNWPWLDLKALGHEPELALFAEDKGLEIIKKLISQLGQKIDRGWKTRYLLLEADPSQHQNIIAYADNAGWKHSRTRGYILEFTRDYKPLR